MTFRRRLFVANVLMVAVPVLATALVALACAAAVWHGFTGGRGFDGDEDLRQASWGLSALAEAALASPEGFARDEGLGRLGDALDKAGLALRLTPLEADVASLSAESSPSSAGAPYGAGRGTLAEAPLYEHGARQAADDALLAAARGLAGSSGEGLAQVNGRTVMVTHLVSGGAPFELALFGDIRPDATYAELKAALAAGLAVVLLTVLGSTLLVGRFLARFLVRRIEDPLGRLERGLRALAGGDLSHRIRYEGRDEFAGACADFDTMAEHLESATRELRRQDETRRRLVADVSHDLRSPLTSIRAYAEGLLDGVAATPERRRHYLATIVERTQEVVRLADDLLGLSKLELGEGAALLRPLRVDRLVEGIAREASDRPREPGAPRVELACDLRPVSARADAGLLRRIVANICENAVKYAARDGRVGIRLSVRAEGTTCVLEVADDGPGVPADQLARLFDEFWRADAARARTTEGSGIGLAFVRRAAELMGGHVSACDVEPHGLAVRVELPLADGGPGGCERAGGDVLGNAGARAGDGVPGDAEARAGGDMPDNAGAPAGDGALGGAEARAGGDADSAAARADGPVGDGVPASYGEGGRP